MLILLAPLLAACPKQSSDAPPVPPAAIAVDAKAQVLDTGLKDAYHAIDGGNYDAGRKLVDAYLKHGGARPGQAEFLLGFACHKQDLYTEGLEHLTRAVELEPGYLATYYYLGFAQFQLGHMPEARKAYETFLRAQPDKPDALFGLGLVALEQDRIDEAAQKIGRAIELVRARAREPKQADDAHRDLGRYLARMADVKLRQEDLAGARDALRESVTLVPDIPDVWSKLERVLVRLGDEPGAKEAEARYTALVKARAAKSGGGK